jgi:hypothetical protein
VDSDPDLKPKKVSGAVIVRRILITMLFLATCGFWIYKTYIMVKSPLGGPCTWDMQCLQDAPKCLKTSVDAEGSCSRQCANDNECAAGVVCVSVGLDEVDAHGRSVEAGYCIPQATLEALRPNRAKKMRDGGLPSTIDAGNKK